MGMSGDYELAVNINRHRYNKDQQMFGLVV